jgi:hypothetical protein
LEKGIMNRGLLLTMTEPPPAMEEEFNAWYDSEHFPERLGIRGFRSARRWVADTPPGQGKYLATYELDSAQVLFTPEYLARLNAPTAWTRRCLDKAEVFRRWACEQTFPGGANPHPSARAILLVLSESVLEGLNVPSALQLRRFVASSGDPQHIALFELAEASSRLPVAPAGTEMRVYRAYDA